MKNQHNLSDHQNNIPDKQPTQHRKYTSARIHLVALITIQMQKTAEQYVNQPLTESQKEGLSQMAEDIAFNLPEDTSFNRLNGISTDALIHQIREKHRPQQAEPPTNFTDLAGRVLIILNAIFITFLLIDIIVGAL